MKHPSSLGALPAVVWLLACICTADEAAKAAKATAFNVEIVKPIECARKSRVGDRLHVSYRGTLQKDGSEFDSSYGRQPIAFELGRGRVIKGWDMGLLAMCVGEKRKLTIPPEMGYGDADMGKIPPNSVLLFDTELVAMDSRLPDTTEELKPTASEAGSPDGPSKGGDEHHGECRLFGRFAILVQGALGGLALLALVWKHFRERPRRPVVIWLYDVSKQVVGSILIHFANLFLSIVSSGSFGLTSSSKSASTAAGNGERKHPNPCSFYLLNLAIDTTVGVAILVFFLRLFHLIALRTPLANPPESLTSGNYGSPPSTRWWLKQLLLYFLGLFAMKLCVFLLFVALPWLGWVGDWALRWTEGREWVQITFVMLVFPLVMNAAQYWIIDSFIKDPGANYDYQAVSRGGRGGGADGDEDAADGAVDETEGLISAVRRRDDDEGPPPMIQPVGGRLVAEHGDKEAGDLPLPAEFEIGAGSSDSSVRGK